MRYLFLATLAFYLICGIFLTRLIIAKPTQNWRFHTNGGPTLARQTWVPSSEPEYNVRPWVGIRVEPLPDTLQAKLQLSRGVLVADVSPKSPAYRAGVRSGDILLRISHGDSHYTIDTPESYILTHSQLIPGEMTLLYLITRHHVLVSEESSRDDSETRGYEEFVACFEPETRAIRAGSELNEPLTRR